MPDNLLTRIRNAWNIFRNNKEEYPYFDVGPGYGYNPNRTRMLLGNERSTVAAVYTRIGIDVSAIPIQHVRLNKNKHFQEVINSGLNNCLTVEANLDQSGRSFIQDVVMSLCDEGCVAIVPVDTTGNPQSSSSYDILTMRTAKIVQWYPEHVMVNLYNQLSGIREDITLPKTTVAIIENPLYSVMNEPNSTLKRLIDKINLLDVIDIQSGSGKLDIIIQLPYAVKTEMRKEQAETRRKMLESQLQDSKYGIAYIDVSEKITQLNRAAENNLLQQIEYLTQLLWSQLGLTKEVFDGTASEEAMINYYNRTIEPFLAAICDSMKRVFITKAGKTQGQSIVAIRNPFSLVSAQNLAELADKLTRNEIVTTNEFRAIIGLEPSSDPKADELRNKNLNQPEEPSTMEQEVVKKVPSNLTEINQNGRSLLKT